MNILNLKDYHLDVIIYLSKFPKRRGSISDFGYLFIFPEFWVKARSLRNVEGFLQNSAQRRGWTI